MSATAHLPRRIVACMLVACLGLVACVQQPETPDSFNFDRTDVVDHRQGRPGEPAATLKISVETPVFEEYLIATGDVLDVVYSLERELLETYPITLYHTLQMNFTNVPSLNETQEVLPDGTVSLPYLGAYSVVGKTTNELRQELHEEYSDILVDPEITVKIQNFNARVEQVRDDLKTSARGLSKLITVRPDGFVTFPFIGDRYVQGRTINDVLDDVAPEYQDFIQGLNVSIFMHEQTGTNIYIIGEVANPGQIQVSRPVNVIQAIARAGGYTREGETSSVFVFRRNADRLEAHRFNITDMSSYGAQAINFYLQPEDILLVPRSKVSSLAQLMREISDIALFNGWSFGVANELEAFGNADQGN